MAGCGGCLLGDAFGCGQVQQRGQLGNFCGIGAAGIVKHLLERPAGHGAYRSRDGALNQGSLTQDDVRPSLWRQHVQRSLGTHQGAAQVHQHEHTFVAVDAVDGSQDLERIGADRGLGNVRPARSRQRDAPLHHLLDDVEHTLRQERAVRNDDDSNHDDVYSGSTALHKARKSSVVEAAPGSMWPALRSPR